MTFESQAFGRRMRQLRKENKISQAELADELGVSPTYISKIECGVKIPSIDLVLSISSYFLVSADYLLRGYEMKADDTRKALRQAINILSDLYSQY